MSGHIEALDLQGELFQFWSGPKGKLAMESCAVFLERDPAYRRALGDARASAAEKMRATPDLEAYKLQHAAPYWVHPDMVRLTMVAAKSMPPESLVETDLPTPAGFVYLGESVTGLFGRDGEMSIDGKPLPADPPLVAFSWGTFGTDIHLMAYTSKAAINATMDVWPRVMILNQHGWTFGDEPDTEGEYWPVHRYCKAFWALCQERIGMAQTVEVDRATRRRAARANLELTGVRVVNLRRRELTPREVKDPKTVVWSCRWVVEGHWQNQWYPKAGIHRQIWIDPYPKGPEDAPFKMKDRVFRVVR